MKLKKKKDENFRRWSVPQSDPIEKIAAVANTLRSIGHSTGKSPMDILLDQVSYTPLPEPENRKSNLPYATHEGILSIQSLEFKVYVLSNGQRVIAEESLKQHFPELFCFAE